MYDSSPVANPVGGGPPAGPFPTMLVRTSLFHVESPSIPSTVRTFCGAAAKFESVTLGLQGSIEPFVMASIAAASEVNGLPVLATTT